MNIIFGLLISISIILILQGEPNVLLLSVASSSFKAVALAGSLVGIYAFWMGIIKILEKTPALAKTERLIYPVVSRIFQGESQEVRKLITMNISANMLGVGGAATPLAISAIKMMKENANAGENSEFTPATKSMLMLFILNATSLQILPTTVISLRTTAGSAHPASVLLPATIASAVATLLGVWVVYIWKITLPKRAKYMQIQNFLKRISRF